MEKIVSKRDRRARCRMAGAVALSALAWTATAGTAATLDRGATVDLVGGTLRYEATRNVAHNLTVEPAGSAYTIHDDGEDVVSPSPRAVGAGCAAIDASTVSCPYAAVEAFDIRTAEGADTIDLTGVADPASVHGGPDDDIIVGGNGDDTFVWDPGDGSDVVDGGIGYDTVQFDGADLAESFAIAAAGAGFELARSIDAVWIYADDVERLNLTTAAGADDVSTTPLLRTEQHIATANDAAADTLRVAANGLCLRRESDRFEVEGRPTIFFTGFANVLTDPPGPFPRRE